MLEVAVIRPTSSLPTMGQEKSYQQEEVLNRNMNGNVTCATQSSRYYNPDNYYDDQYVHVVPSLPVFSEESDWQVISEIEQGNTSQYSAINSLFEQLLEQFDRREMEVTFPDLNQQFKKMEIDQQIHLDISRTMPIPAPSIDKVAQEMVAENVKKKQSITTTFLKKVETAIKGPKPLPEKKTFNLAFTSQWKINDAPAPRDICFFLKRVNELSGGNEEIVYKVTQIFNQRIGIDLFRMAHFYCVEESLMEKYICMPIKQKFDLNLIISKEKAKIVGKANLGAYSRDEVDADGEPTLLHRIETMGFYDLHSGDVEYTVSLN